MCLAFAHIVQKKQGACFVNMPPRRWSGRRTTSNHRLPPFHVRHLAHGRAEELGQIIEKKRNTLMKGSQKRQHDLTHLGMGGLVAAEFEDMPPLADVGRGHDLRRWVIKNRYHGSPKNKLYLIPT